MAVIDSLGISVHVHIDGVPAVEYTDPDPSPDAKYPGTPVVSRYIESKVNKEYSLACETIPQHTWLSTNRDKVLSFVARIDGTRRASKIHRPDQHDKRRRFFIDGVILRPQGASYETVSKFKFDAVMLDDKADASAAKRDKAKAAGLGSIRVEVWRAFVEGHSGPSRRARAPEKTEMSIAEKALKGRAISHGTSLSAPSMVPVGKWSTTRRLYGEPYVIFEFKYRSKDGLRSEMIVPRTPSPVPAASGLAGLSQEEIQRLAEERLAEIKAEKAEIKAEIKEEKKPAIKLRPGELFDLSSENGDGPKKSVVKREFDEVVDITDGDSDGSLRPAKVQRQWKDLVTIDLTDD